MTPQQDALVERIVSVLADDPRVLAAWLSGSLARDAGDAYSDVDVRLVAADDAFEALAADWEKLVERVGPSVLRRQTRMGQDVVVTVVTPEWARYDLAIQPAAPLETRTYQDVRLLFDRAEIAPRIRPAPPADPPGPTRIAQTVEEFLRVMGLMPVVIGRGEWLVSMEGVGIGRRLLIDLMLAETRTVRTGGALRLNPFLTPDQRAQLEALPPLAATRDSVMEAHLALARLALPLARRLLGDAYPFELEDAMRAYLARELSVVV